MCLEERPGPAFVHQQHHFHLVCWALLSLDLSQSTPNENDAVDGRRLALDAPPDTQWIEGIGFIELAPGEEIKSPSKIIVDTNHSTIQFDITYSRSGLMLEYGLQSKDGTEYSREVVGGTDVGAIEDIPSGIYFLFVRNSGDYSELPGYQDKSISFNATGAINYHLGNTKSIEN